jgi:hypothetical protein
MLFRQLPFLISSIVEGRRKSGNSQNGAKGYSPCPARSAKLASPRQVMNHKNLNQDAGIRFEKGWLRLPMYQLLSTGSSKVGTYLFGMVAGACRYVCRLSLLSFEKQAIAGRSIAKNDNATQKAKGQLLLNLHKFGDVRWSLLDTYSFSPNLPHRHHYVTAISPSS